MFLCIILGLVEGSVSVGWFLSADLKMNNHFPSSNVHLCIISPLLISETKIKYIVTLSTPWHLQFFSRIFCSFVFSCFFLRNFFSLINYPSSSVGHSLNSQLWYWCLLLDLYLGFISVFSYPKSLWGLAYWLMHINSELRRLRYENPEFELSLSYM